MPCTIRNRAIILRSKSTKNTRSILLPSICRAPPYPVARRPVYRVGTLVSPSSHPTMKLGFSFLLLLLALSACSRRISERIAVHDTLRVALTDTLREHIMLTDSVLIHDTCYVENGVATRFRLVDRWRQTGPRRRKEPPRTARSQPRPTCSPHPRFCLHSLGRRDAQRPLDAPLGGAPWADWRACISGGVTNSKLFDASAAGSFPMRRSPALW